jgi:hypothetical protein
MGRTKSKHFLKNIDSQKSYGVVKIGKAKGGPFSLEGDFGQKNIFFKNLPNRFVSMS